MIILAVMCAATLGAQWLDFAAGLAQMERSGRPVLIDFYTDWCHWCKVMDEKTFGEAKVKAYLKAHFVTVRLQAEDREARVTFRGKTYTHVEFTRAMGVSGFPTVVFLDKTGEPITRLPGYVPADQFLPILKYIHGECYQKQMSFEEFLKRQEECE